VVHSGRDGMEPTPRRRLTYQVELVVVDHHDVLPALDVSVRACVRVRMRVWMRV
jgi:hypothetical protein